MTEQWKPVVGYEGRYEVSDEGHVRSLRRVDRRGATVRERILATPANRYGYPEASLALDGTTKTRLVHVLVLEAFIGPRPDGMDGCHSDGNPSNNAVANLRWDTHHANMLDATQQGRMGRPRTTVCPKGHVKDRINSRGHSYCSACQAENGRAYRRRKTGGA